MTAPQILLDPVDFDALHLSFLANGGVGAGHTFEKNIPHCVLGHAAWLAGTVRHTTADAERLPLGSRMAGAGLTWRLNDSHIGVNEKIDFEEYIRRLNIDIKEG